MRSLMLILLSLLLPLPLLLAQSGLPKGFGYQALLYDGAKPLSSTTVNVEVTLQSVNQEIYLVERHFGVKTTDYGLADLCVGTGLQLQGSLESAKWESGVFLTLKVERDGNYKSLGNPVRIPTVPYALHAHRAEYGGGNGPASVSKPLFNVLNSQGRSIFSVYEHGVRMSVADEQERGVRGGFAVSTYAKGASGDEVSFQSMSLSNGRVELSVLEEELRGVRGGFAVSSRGTDGTSVERLNLSGPGASFTIDEELRGVRGGFAVLRSGASFPSMYLDGGSVQFTVDPSNRGVRGGFAVSSYDAIDLRSNDVHELFQVNDRQSYFTLISSHKHGRKTSFTLRDRRNDNRVMVSFSGSGSIYAGDGKANNILVSRPSDPSKLQVNLCSRVMSQSMRWNYPEVTYDGVPVQYRLEIDQEKTDAIFRPCRVYNAKLQGYVEGFTLREDVSSDHAYSIYGRVVLLENPELSVTLGAGLSSGIQLRVFSNMIERVSLAEKRVIEQGKVRILSQSLTFVGKNKEWLTSDSPIANLQYSTRIIGYENDKRVNASWTPLGLELSIEKEFQLELISSGVINLEVELSSKYFKDESLKVNIMVDF